MFVFLGVVLGAVTALADWSSLVGAVVLNSAFCWGGCFLAATWRQTRFRDALVRVIMFSWPAMIAYYAVELIHTQRMVTDSGPSTSRNYSGTAAACVVFCVLAVVVGVVAGVAARYRRRSGAVGWLATLLPLLMWSYDDVHIAASCLTDGFAPGTDRLSCDRTLWFAAIEVVVCAVVIIWKLRSSRSRPALSAQPS